MPAPALVEELVRRFLDNEPSYRSANYKEDQLRQEFLNPFFECLGWDMANREGYALAYRDVIHEDSLLIDGQAKAPDYSFRIGEVRKFFIEAKKPAVQIARDPDSAYQLRRYAWSAKLPVSILTNFGELAVYDCSQKPDQDDKAATGRIEFLYAKDYAEKWDMLFGHFSKQAILKGSFDKYAVGNKGRRGTATVDAAFLLEIEGWRELLALNFAKKNAAITQAELNYAVQVTIDRIIFLRMCEDRGMETYGRLKELTEGTGAYGRLQQLFALADDRYNSGLFHFNNEKDRSHPDRLTHTLALDDKPLKQIFKSLYYPESPYVFNVMPADILGQVYEQFLGKVIVLNNRHVAKVEEKPEVKKAGGVYYTPTYIVEYIVRQTVGKLLEGATAETASQLRILDPACGSGSFLLVAYDHLLKWYLKLYIDQGPEKHGKALVKVGDREYRLTTAEKKRILIDNIYGVDIDTQAVEVTKLSLLLKVLEGETDASLKSSPKLTGERVLPDLDRNIQCGNSLIGPEIRDSAAFQSLTEIERMAISPFNWKTAFAKVFKFGGFHAVIGNPPYVLQQWIQQRSTFDFFAANYATAKYKIDTYHLFFERGLELLKAEGYLGFITPNTFLRNKHARELRSLLLERTHISILRVYYFNVFKASVDTAVCILRKSTPDANAVNTVEKSLSESDVKSFSGKYQLLWKSHPELHFGLPGNGITIDIKAKFRKATFALGEIATAYFGIQTHDRATHVGIRKPTKHHLPCIDGGSFGRYRLSPPKEYVDFQPRAIKSGGKVAVYLHERIGIRQIGCSPIATLLPGDIYTLNTIYNVFFIRPTQFNLKFILGLICSKALSWYWKLEYYDQKATFPKIKKEAILGIPIPSLDLTSPRDATRHDSIVQLVEAMLSLHVRLAAAKTPHEATSLQSQIEATDARIDAIVYELYGLTAEEIAIVEATTHVGKE